MILFIRRFLDENSGRLLRLFVPHGSVSGDKREKEKDRKWVIAYKVLKKSIKNCGKKFFLNTFFYRIIFKKL